MKLALDEDQKLLASSVAAFVAKRSPLSRIRTLRDADDPLGHSAELFAEMAELGWLGMAFDEAHGGVGLGLASLVIVAEGLGRALAPEPLMASAVLAGGAVARWGSPAQRERHVPGIVAGTSLAAMAIYEPGMRFDLDRMRARAVPRDGGWVLRGTKRHVLGAPGADLLVVMAGTETSSPAGSLGAFLVDPRAPGVTVERERRIDGRSAGTVVLEGVQVAGDARLGEAGDLRVALHDLLDAATVVLAAEMLGGMCEAFDRTLAYLKERQQFGVPIGSFQALKHRAARAFIELELCRSSVMAAARAVDSRSDDARALVSLAKARCSDAFILVANEAIQMHGGIGMTDEHDIGFFLKRARAAEMTFGDGAYHRDRFARSVGF